MASYFRCLELPDRPTLYDHLVLSLRDKDLIATFNWDPFLYAACMRNQRRAQLPHVVYLHGNVSIGFCLKDRSKGLIGSRCSRCGQAFEESQLLFPVLQKNYAANPYIAAEWKTLRAYLKDAYMLTIFGYGAPISDTQAVALMKKAWGSPQSRNLEEIEIIDIKSEDELRTTWQDFIHTHHYSNSSNFYDSWIANHPRRTCDAMWNTLMECRFVTDNPVPREEEFEALWAWYQPLLEAEKARRNQ